METKTCDTMPRSQNLIQICMPWKERIGSELRNLAQNTPFLRKLAKRASVAQAVQNVDHCHRRRSCSCDQTELAWSAMFSTGRHDTALRVSDQRLSDSLSQRGDRHEQRASSQLSNIARHGAGVTHLPSPIGGAAQVV